MNISIKNFLKNNGEKINHSDMHKQMCISICIKPSITCGITYITHPWLLIKK